MQKRIISLFLCLVLGLTALAGSFSVSAETNVNSSDYFTVTNNLSGRNANNVKYIDFAVNEYVERTPNALNGDGFSYKIGTLEGLGHNYPYVNVSPNCHEPLFAEDVANAEAIITVLSADENNPSVYPMTYEVLNVSNDYENDIAIGDSTTTLYIIQPNGSLTATKDFVTGDYKTEFGLNSGETAVFVTTIPTNVEGFDLTDEDLDVLVRFHSLRDACAEAYTGNNYYIDSIGLTDDVAAFETAITSIADPIEIKAESYKGLLEASWSLSDIYAEADITAYHVNLFDSEGNFVRSKTVTDTKVNFNVIAGGSYKLQVSAFDSNGNFVVNSAMAQVTDELYFNITKGFAEAENMLNGPWNGEYTYNQFVTDRPVTPHNPDGKSLMLGKGTDGNDWVNIFFKTGIGTSATGADSAAVFVITVEDTAEIYNMRFAINGNDTYNTDIVSIDSDGVTEVLENQTYFIPKKNTVNYIIVPLAKNNVTNVDEIKIWSDCSAVCDWKYYFDSLGFTNNVAGLIDELTKVDDGSYFNITKGFTEAEDMLNGPWNGEYIYNQFVTDRPVTPHNPDGKSLMLGKGTDGNDWVNIFFKTGIGTSATGADSAAVFVITVEDTAEIYNMRFAINGNDTYNTDIVSIDSNGVTEVLENQTYFIPKKNTVNYIIVPLARNNVTNVDEIKIWSDCSAVCDWKYYFDSLGFTDNAAGLVDELIAVADEEDETFFNITKGFAESENMLNGPWNGEYTYNQFVTDRPITPHNPDGKSLMLGKGTDGNDWVNIFFKTGIGTGATGADSAAVFVITVEDTAEIYNMRFAINGNDTYNTDIVSIGNDGVTEVLENQIYFTPKTNTVNYIIVPLAKNNVTNVDEIKIWSDCSAVCDWKYYFDSLGFTNNAAGLIASLKANEIVAGAAFETDELVIPESSTVTLNGFAVSGIEKAVSFFGSNPDIITVDEKTGIVTATGTGTAYVSVSVDGTDKTADCKITVKAVELGDVGYDDVIDIRDLVRMKKYIAEITNDIAIKGADFNYDGIVNASDLTSMRKFLLNGKIREKSDLGFGYFGANLSLNSAYNDTKQMLENGIANTFFVSDAYSLAQLSKNGGGAWVDVYSIYADASTDADDNVWKANFDNLVADLKATGYWDAVNGWFIDEPLDHQAVKKVSEYATKYNKRFFVCYLAASVAPNIPEINPVDNPYDLVGITEETTQYITDIAYDLYFNPSKNTSIYEQINYEMHKNLGNNNPKIWHIAFAAFDSTVLTATAEEKAVLCEEMIADLNTMYDFLKREENKGGLLCYSYDKPAYDGQYGLWQINQITNGAFNAYITRANEIGREICSSSSAN